MEKPNNTIEYNGHNSKEVIEWLAKHADYCNSLFKERIGTWGYNYTYSVNEHNDMLIKDGLGVNSWEFGEGTTLEFNEKNGHIDFID